MVIKSKHDIKYFLVRECIKRNKLAIQYIIIKLMFAYPLMKGKSLQSFRDYMQHIRIDSSLLNIFITLVMKLLIIYFVFFLSVYMKFKNDIYYALCIFTYL